MRPRSASTPPRSNASNATLDLVLACCFVVFGYVMYLLWCGVCLFVAYGAGYALGVAVRRLLEVMPW